MSTAGIELREGESKSGSPPGFAGGDITHKATAHAHLKVDADGNITQSGSSLARDTSGANRLDGDRQGSILIKPMDAAPEARITRLLKCPNPNPDLEDGIGSTGFSFQSRIQAAETEERRVSAAFLSSSDVFDREGGIHIPEPKQEIDETADDAAEETKGSDDEGAEESKGDDDAEEGDAVPDDAKEEKDDAPVDEAYPKELEEERTASVVCHNFQPRSFTRAKLNMENYQPHEKLTDFRLVESVNRATIRLFWVTGLSKMHLSSSHRKQLGTLVSSFPNIQVLGLQDAGIAKLDTFKLPNLLYVDLTANRIADVNSVIKFSARSPFIQALNVVGNPFMRRSKWTDTLPSAKSQAWKIVLNLPDLAVLNNEHITAAVHVTAAARFGKAPEQQRAAGMGFDAAFSARVPELETMTTWQPERITELHLSGCGLTALHLLPFVNLAVLDASHNELTTLSSFGLEVASKLTAASFSGNPLPAKVDLTPLKFIVRLRNLFLDASPLSTSRNYRLRVIHMTRDLFGTQRFGGLKALDGEPITMEERLAALNKIGKVKSAFIEEHRWRLALRTQLGKSALQDPNFESRMFTVDLPAMKLRSVNLMPFKDTLQVVRLPNNLLTKAGPRGLGACLQLRVVDLRGNPVEVGLSSGCCQSSATVLKELASLEQLRAVAIAPDPTKLSEKQWKATLASLVAHSPFLLAVEDRVPTMAERIEAYKRNGLRDAALEKYRVDLATTVSIVDVTARRYDPESTGFGGQYQPNEVKSLLRLHGIGITNSALNLSSFPRLEQVNLANNSITNILELGLEQLSRIRMIDLSGNKLKNKPSVIGEFLNEIATLEVISLRGNPSMKKFTKSRLEVIGGMQRMREIECSLRVIDTEVTVSERVQALKKAGVDTKEAEGLRAQVALHMRTARGVAPNIIQTLDLQGMELRTISLSSFANLRVLRLNNNKIAVLHGIGLDRMKHLAALDLRDNLLDLRKPQDIASAVTNCIALEYIGLANKGMSQKEVKTYRHRVVSAFERLRNVKCRLRYLDDSEIAASEIVDTMKSDSTETREKFRFDLVRRRVLGTQKPAAFKELNLSGHQLGLVDFSDFPNLVKIDISENNLHTAALAKSGLKDLEKLRELTVRGNPVGSAKHFGDMVNDLRHLRALECDATPMCPEGSDADRIKVIGSIPRSRRLGFKLKYLNAQGISVSERCAGALVSGTDQKKVERLRLNLTLEEMELDLKNVTSLDLANREIADIAVLGYNVTKMGNLRKLQVLDISNNRMRTLEKMRLGHLPALTSLDLRDNLLPDIPSIVLELEQCASLEVLYLQNSTESDTKQPELYIAEVCSRLRSLKAVDDLENNIPFSEVEKRAATYLHSVCGMSLNGVNDIDLSNKGLSRDSFFFVLSALVQLNPVSVRLNGNKWNETGVGPQNKFYRFYVIGAMEESVNNRLETIDGLGITDDDKEAAINFLRNEEAEFGDTYPIYRIMHGDWEDDRFVAKAKAESEDDRMRRVAREGAKFRKQKGPQIRDYQRDGARAKGMTSEGNTSKAAAAARDAGGNAASVVSGAAASAILTVAPRATGSLLNKMEIIIGFFQIYGLVLAISFDFDIPYPKLWIDVSKYYDWIPNLLSIDVNNIFVRLDVDLGQHASTVKLLGSLLVYMFFIAIYFVGAGLDKVKWTEKYINNWRRSSTIAFLVWFLSLFVAAGIAIGVDSESREKATSLEQPSAYAITLTAVIAGGFTVMFILWQIVVRIFRSKYNKYRGGVEFTKFWSRSKRAVQRLSLFVLTIAYMPVSRMILTNFASEYETSVLDSTGCVYTDNQGRRCCSVSFPAYPCIQSPAATMLWLQYVSLAFAVIIVLGIPLFFVYLIRKGIEAVDVAGFEQANRRFEQKVQLLESEIKNKTQTAKKEASEGERTKALALRNEVKGLKKTLKQTHENWKNTFAYEVGKNPKAQTYLYQAYERKARFSKILQMFEKLLLVCIAIYVPSRVLEEWKMFLSTCVVGFMTILSVIRTPFNDGFEDAMDVISRFTNSINVGISFGLSVDFIPAWIASMALVGSNGFNLLTALFTLVISPIRSCLAQRSYRRHLEAQQSNAIEARKRAREAAAAARATASSAGGAAGSAASAAGSAIASGSAAGAQATADAAGAGAGAVASSASAAASGASEAASGASEAASGAGSAVGGAASRAPSLAVAAGRATLTEAARFHEQNQDDIAESLALAQNAMSGAASELGDAVSEVVDELDEDDE